MEVLVALVFIAAAFIAGRNAGRKAPSSDAQALRQARETAWQEGYEAAVRFLGERRREPGPSPELPDAVESGPEQDKHLPAAGIPRPAAFQTTEPQAAPQPDAVPPPAGQPCLAGAAADIPAVPGASGAWQDRPRILQTGGNRTAAQPPAPAAPVKVLSKRERELRNINVTLYVAALMIVAAGALFLSFALLPLAKLVALFALAAAFYGGGLAVHATRESLRPAAAAFAGTGLALLPLCAIATYNTVDLSGPTVWLVFSAIATVAVGYATVRFRSRVLAWLAVLILVSTAMASAATMQRGVFYYLLVLLVLSIILLLAATRSRTVRDSIFFQALKTTAQMIPALVLALAVILSPALTARNYLWVFFLLTAQLLLSVRLFERARHLRFLSGRATAMLTVIAGCALLELPVRSIALVVAVLLAAQALAVVLAGDSYRAIFAVDARLWRIERATLWILALLSVVTAYQASAFGADTGLISFVAVPVLVLAAVPGLWRQAKIELAALLAFAVLPGMDNAAEPWRLLPALGLALLVVLALRTKMPAPWSVAYRVIGWALCLALGVTAGAAAGDLGYPAQPAALSVASVLGLWVPLFALWAMDAVASGSKTLIYRGIDLRQLRLACSAALALASLALLTSLDFADAEAYYGLEPVGWFNAGAVPTLALTILAALRAAPRSLTKEHAVRGTAAAVLALVYLLSLGASLWQPGLAIALVLLAYFLAEARRVRIAGWKMIYAGAAQLTFSSAVWWFTGHMNFDGHGQFALFSVSVVLPQLVRLGSAWRQRRELRLELRIIAWGMLVFIPVSTLGYSSVDLDADRGVLLLQSLLFGLYGTALFMAEHSAGRWRQAYLFAPLLSVLALIQIPALDLSTQSGWVRNSWWDTPVAFGLLLVLSGAAAAAEWIFRRRPDVGVAVGAGMFLPLLVLNAWNPGDGWVLASAALTAVYFALMVHTRSVAWFALGSGLAACAALLYSVQLWRNVQVLSRLQSLDVGWALLAATFVFYVMAATHGRFAEARPSYPAEAYRAADARGSASRLYLLMGLACAFGAGALAHLGNREPGPVLGGAALVFAVAVALRIFECPQQLKPYTLDLLLPLAAYLGISSYTILEHLPEASILACYSSLVFVLLVVWRNLQKTPVLANRYLVVAGVMANLAMLANLVDAKPATRIYALIFFAALIAYGLKQGRRLYIWWGAATITLAVLWSLRSLAFLWLVILGVGLIAAAVIKLSRVDSLKQGGGPAGSIPSGSPQPGQHPVPGAPWPPSNRPDAGEDQPDSRQPR